MAGVEVKSLIGGILEAVRGQTPVPFTSNVRIPAWLGGQDRSRELKATSSVGTMFAIVNRTSTAVASVDWNLFRKSPTGDTEKRVQVRSHWALDLWNRPNSFMSRPEFMEICQQHMDLCGEMWWVIAYDERAQTLPLSMWPVRPDRIAPVPHPRQYISHYEYQAPNGQTIPLTLAEVIHIKMPNPNDTYRGLGPVQSILSDLDATRFSAEWNRQFFLNNAEPGGIIRTDKRLTDTQLEEFQLRWAEQHQGLGNAHRVAILENMEWIERKFTNRDMQFAELRTVSSEVILEAYGMPKFAVGRVDDVNRATADASDAWFGKQITVPRLERIKGALNTRFLLLFGPGADRLEFDYVSPVEEDYERANLTLKTKAEAWSVLVTQGMDPIDAARICGLPEDFLFEKPEPPAIEPPPGGGDDPNAVANRLRARMERRTLGPASLSYAVSTPTYIDSGSTDSGGCGGADAGG
jgi:HK97 family phage portal protein